MVFPSFEEAASLSSTFDLIPICVSVFADTETPVSVHKKLFAAKSCSFLLESVSGADTVARYSFLGADPYMIFRASGKDWTIEGEVSASGTGDPVEELKKLVSSHNPAHIQGLPRFCGGAVGFFSYDSIRLWENIPDSHHTTPMVDDIFYGFYRSLIAFDNREKKLLFISNVKASTLTKESYTETVAFLRAEAQKLSHGAVSPTLDIREIGSITSTMTREEYERAVSACKEYILAGDIFQVVLSQRFSVPVAADAFDLYRVLRSVNPSPYMYFLSLDGMNVIGASPEMLVRVEDRTVMVRPIAGTRRRGATDAEDTLLSEELLGDPKERAEHVMLVDLGRNDTGRVSEYGSVTVDAMMRIEKYSHVIHMVSDVRGTLKKEATAIDALLSCFPAGTLSGAPKIRAMEIIDELEPTRRGLYGGTLGYIDFSGNLDSCIVIRTIIYKDGIAYIQAGAGIVADSVPSTEFDETVNKARSSFKALENALQMTTL